MKGRDQGGQCFFLHFGVEGEGEGGGSSEGSEPINVDASKEAIRYTRPGEVA